VALSKEQKEMLDELARFLGVSESEMLPTTLMDYTKDVCLVKERLNRRESGVENKN
jgi:hypothetical protein